MGKLDFGKDLFDKAQDRVKGMVNKQEREIEKRLRTDGQELDENHVLPKVKVSHTSRADAEEEWDERDVVRGRGVIDKIRDFSDNIGDRFGNRNALLIGILALIVVFSGIFGIITASGGERMLTVVYTTDMHGAGAYAKGSSVGYEKVSGVIDQAKAEGSEVIVLDAGDAFSGLAMAELDQGTSIARLMQTTGYDAMVPGFHDFDYGQEQLTALNNQSSFSMVCANLMKADNTTLFEPYIIKETGKLKVAVIGVISQRLQSAVPAANSAGLTITDPVTAVTETIETIGKKADVIIVLSHVGNTTSNGSMALAQIEGVDLVVDGYGHTYTAGGQKSGDTAAMVVTAGSYGAYVGRVNIAFEGRDMIGAVESSLAVNDTDSVEGRAEVKAQTAEVNTAQAALLKETAATLTTALDADQTLLQIQETDLGCMITDAMRTAVPEADVAIISASGIVGGLKSGAVTVGDVSSILADEGSYMVTKRMTGGELKNVLEHAVEAHSEPSPAYLQVSGIYFLFNNTLEIGSRIDSTLIKMITTIQQPAGTVTDEDEDGAQDDADDQDSSDTSRFEVPFDDAQIYTVVMPDYLAKGADGYSTLAAKEVVCEYGTVTQAILDYLAATPNFMNTMIKDRID